MALTLGKDQRLLKPKQFQNVYRSKHWGGSDHYIFNIKPLEPTLKNKAGPRLGVTVAKKVSKLAVDRNRIKRQIKEFFRQNLQQLDEVDLVITAKPSCAAASDQQRQESLERLLNKILGWQRWHSNKRL